MGGPGEGQPAPQNKIEKLGRKDVWEALRKSLKTSDEGGQKKTKDV